MKVAIESSGLLTKHKTGVEYYTQRLLRSLFEIDSKTDYYLVYMAIAGRAAPDFQLDYPNVQPRRISWMPGKIYNLLLRLPLTLPFDVLAGLKTDIYFFPNFARWPLALTKKSVVVVHDVSYLEYPEVMKTKHHQWYLTRTVPKSIQRATHVVTISENTKKQLMKYYGTAEDKITVIVPSVDHDVYAPAKPTDISRIKQKYGIKQDYLLYLGTLEPRKNIERIVTAYAALPDSLQAKYQLVLGGGSGWGGDAIGQALARLSKANVVVTGYVDQADVAALYSGATVFVYPSIYEGWGMQVLEAMACGTPVLTANNSSLPEVGGAAAAYVEAKDQTDINRTLVKLLRSPKLLSRMSAKGLAHARQFSWEKSGERLHQLFQRL